MRLPECEDMRDNKAIARLAEGFVKLLFPDLTLDAEEFNEYCVNPAVRMRQQVRDELAKLDPEFKWVTIKSSEPDEFQLSHPDTRPEPVEANTQVDPFDPGREPVETTTDLKAGQKGISYEKLFGPYLREAKSIRLVDPYIRYDYQIHNLMNFCEFLAPTNGHIQLELETSGDSEYQEVELSAKLDELQENLAKNSVVFKYELKHDLHDRWIETDTGWRIMLGRGLDIFQKPEGHFTLGFIDQTKRRCKGTTITYSRTS